MRVGVPARSLELPHNKRAACRGKDQRAKVYFFMYDVVKLEIDDPKIPKQIPRAMAGLDR
jgi:hypothetical protein